MSDTTIDTEVQRDETQTDYTIVDSTGRVQQIGSMPAWMLADQDAHVPEGGRLLPGSADFYADYADSSTTPWTLKPRPQNPAVLRGMTISDVPSPSAVTVGGDEPVTVTDGEVELSFSHAGTYTVVVSCFPWLDASFTVTQT
jgi:hypothetical protein